MCHQNCIKRGHERERISRALALDGVTASWVIELILNSSSYVKASQVDRTSRSDQCLCGPCGVFIDESPWCSLVPALLQIQSVLLGALEATQQR